MALRRISRKQDSPVSCNQLCPGSGEPVFIKNVGTFMTVLSVAGISPSITAGSIFSLPGTYTANQGDCIPSRGQFITVNVPITSSVIATSSVGTGTLFYPLLTITGVVMKIIPPTNVTNGSLSILVLSTNALVLLQEGPIELIQATSITFPPDFSELFSVNAFVVGPVDPGTF